MSLSAAASLVCTAVATSVLASCGPTSESHICRAVNSPLSIARRTYSLYCWSICSCSRRWRSTAASMRCTAIAARWRVSYCAARAELSAMRAALGATYRPPCSTPVRVTVPSAATVICSTQ